MSWIFNLLVGHGDAAAGELGVLKVATAAQVQRITRPAARDKKVSIDVDRAGRGAAAVRRTELHRHHTRFDRLTHHLGGY